MAPLPRAPHEVNRILTRLAVEYTAAGWTAWSLAKECGVHFSVLKRWETGKVTNPLLSLLVAATEPLNLRVDLVAPHHQPLLELDEGEVQALIRAAAGNGWMGEDCRDEWADHLSSALRKLGKITTEASKHV